MLIGEFHHSLDVKSRLIVPVKFREEIGRTFVMTRGLEGCLFVFSQKEWENISDKMATMPLMKKQARQFSRMFLSGAAEVDVDKNGRFIIPQVLQNFAQLEKDCVIIGVQDRLEIWSKSRWTEFCEDSFDQYEEIAEQLIEFEIKL
ncbi:MAG: division/cell wall cluster transcriptional repressor MraZ [Culicoidibacterales bacterium]